MKSSSRREIRGSRPEPSRERESPTVPPATGSTEIEGSWTFLSNHSHVLLCIRNQSDITAREIADRVGITERAVQRILADLIHDGYLMREKRGRQNVYTLQPEKRLRHPLEHHCTIGGLMEFLASGHVERKGNR